MFDKAPYSFDVVNLYNSSFVPSSLHSRNTALSQMLQRYLLQKVVSRFEFTGIPEEWSKNYFTYSLFGYGYLAIINTEEFGTIPQHCSLAGYDVFYQPNKAIVSNMLLPLKEYDLNRNAILIKMQPDYMGIWDAIVYYADLMATAIESACINLINSKFAYVFIAKNKTQAESFKKMFDQIQSGNPAVFMDKTLFNEQGDPAWLEFNQNIKQMYIAGDIFEDVKKIESMFNTLIGIPNVNIAKSSGVSAEEVNANNEDTYSHCELWLETMKEGLKKANEMFGLNLDVKLRELGGLKDDSVFDGALQLRPDLI